MVAKPQWYNAVLAGFRKLRDHGADRVESLESLMSFGMGSAPNGGTVSHLMCGNTTHARSCSKQGSYDCTRCHLIKYCSEKCKAQHWPRHRPRCTHRYLDATWQPSWVTEGRDPTFLYPSYTLTLFRQSVDFWGDLPAMDCLQLPTNEEINGPEPLGDLKLCFAGKYDIRFYIDYTQLAAASGDLRNLIRTINSLPSDYAGYCDILLNDTNPVLVNRNLVILFVLLSSGPSLEEAAEFSTHLMYSAALSKEGAEYVQRCIEFIYESGGEFEADLSFHRCLDTRGEGKVYSVQPSAGIRRLLEMFHSTYPLSSALRSMKETTLAPDRLDLREKYFAGLHPSHRMAFKRFRESGILVPFSLNTAKFTEPNRFLFSPQGTWMVPEDANPLFGWDVAGVKSSGMRHGASPEDILGCLFFHVKDELREFAKRIKELRIDIHVTSFDAGILAKGITIGALPAFEDASFDRIVTSNLVDSIGLRACLADWGPLLNRENSSASILMHSKAWHTRQSHPTAQWGPHAMKVLMEKCHKIPGLEVKMRAVFAQGLRSPALFRIVESIDAWTEDEGAFQDYLTDQDTDRSATALDLRLRSTPQVHPRRFGIPLNAPPWQKLPDLSSNEFYDLFTIGGANLPVRFLEFEGVDVATSSDCATSF
ncbi:hypothetical protein B0H15DRAFT_925988 [Mycena belliarum]|uniref:MYND-type domain-containing protein n=1 Tax=Mycena belliarum TaxID=1033014 RepID=A0AAD6XHK9_9AGAR|nr:hypothetical protein B0H15DRAFT_925988 [Mycena belliae]